MNTFLGYVTVLTVFLLLAAPSLVGYVHDRRIDRELREAETAPRSPDVRREPAGLELVVEGDRTLDRDLVGRRPPLEEVGQLLDALELHERERV